MDDRQALLSYARRARRRLALVRAVDVLCRALFHAAVLALLAVLILRALGQPVPWAAGLAGLGTAVVLAAVVAAFVPRVSLGESAARIDAAAGWKERLSSALAVGVPSHPMEAALVEDVRGRLNRASPSSLLPLRAPRELKGLPVAAAGLVLAAWLMPTLDLFGAGAEARRKEEERARVATALQKLQEKRKELEKDPGRSEAVQKALEKIDAMAREFEKTPPADPKQALAKLSELSEELKKLKNEQARAQAMAEQIQKALSREGAELGELGRMLQQGKFDQAAIELAKMRTALKDKTLTPEEREKLRKQIEEVAKKLADRKELQDLEKKLADAMKGVERQDEKPLEDLQEAMEDLQQGLDDQAALADALKDLENLADALAQGKGECPSCGKKKKEPGESGEG